jgi:hypothetical protein
MSTPLTVPRLRALVACRRRYAADLLDRAEVTIRPDGSVAVVHADPDDRTAWDRAGEPVLQAVLDEYATSAPWPEHVTARHLTWAGEFLRDLNLTVDVSADSARRGATCRGCGDGLHSFDEGSVSAWARDHAAACRALPRPEVA